MMPKSLFASKTFWFNVLSGAVELVQLLTGARVIPPDIAGLIVAGVNIVLRFFTDRPVTLTGNP